MRPRRTLVWKRALNRSHKNGRRTTSRPPPIWLAGVRPAAESGPPTTSETPAASGTAAVAQRNDETAPLFPGDEAGKLNERWNAVQVGFVDEPRKAVEDADSLVASTMQRLAEMFSEERSKLEGQWDRGDDVSTEDLRVALRRYRAFFGRLLAV